MNALVFLAALLSVSAFDLRGKPYVVKPGQEIAIQHDQIRLEFDGKAPQDIEVIDSKGRDVVRAKGVVVQDGQAQVSLKAHEVQGYVCGPMTIKVGGVELFQFNITGHHGCAEGHKH
jgi:hypothetical protein